MLFQPQFLPLTIPIIKVKQAPSKSIAVLAQ
jgi:hypothetical protein